MTREVLPDVPYVQLVFTIPKMLRKPFLFDRSLYGDLCRAAYEATRKFFEAQFPTLERAVPAMLLAPQSFGSLLNPHPHAHALTSLGVVTRDGIFHSVPDDIDFSPLENLFREEVFKSFLKKERITPERIELLRSWRHSGFSVSSDRRIPRGGLPSLRAGKRIRDPICSVGRSGGSVVDPGSPKHRSSVASIPIDGASWTWLKRSYRIRLPGGGPGNPPA